MNEIMVFTVNGRKISPVFSVTEMSSIKKARAFMHFKFGICQNLRDRQE